MSDSGAREFKDIRKGGSGENAPALPVDEFMADLEALQASVATAKNEVWPKVADGTLSMDLLKRLCKEYYFLGVHYTKEFGSIVSNAPDTEALQMERSEHFHHWLQNLADETGFTGDRNHVDMKVEWAHQLGIGDDELLGYVPMPERRHLSPQPLVGRPGRAQELKRSTARIGRWSDPVEPRTSPSTTSTTGVTTRWSIWLCGRPAGHVGPSTARRQPGRRRTST